ncbi:hypothetical protein C8J56DRAFT_1131245 [Mycena floridula]|nr:hypothetical protein C8J56DRAFT_1131245 [Mycena floridula]
MHFSVLLWLLAAATFSTLALWNTLQESMLSAGFLACFLLPSENFDLAGSDAMAYASHGFANHSAMVDARSRGFHANLGSHQPPSEPKWYKRVMVYAQTEADSRFTSGSHQPRNPDIEVTCDIFSPLYVGLPLDR